jgi:hypothetical protein
MRHTLTLEPDVDAALAAACRSTGKPFKEVVNTLLRNGLALQESLRTAPPLVIEPISMGGLRPGISLDSVSALESLLEEDLLR